MTKIEQYQEILKNLDQWDPFLLKESCLPGKRGNLELLHAVIEEGNEKIFLHLLEYGKNKDTTGTREEFTFICGVAGLGQLLVKQKYEYFRKLKKLANHPQWRVREAVVIALQYFGKHNSNRLLDEMETWIKGSCMEKRAAAAALCEPVLLNNEKFNLKVLEFLKIITESIKDIKDRKSSEFITLRKGLGYCWSVAAAAQPEEGKKYMEMWFETKDKDINWIMKENLKKNRLTRIDKEWVNKCKLKLSKF